MKLNRHQKFTLRMLVENPTVTNSEIAHKLSITSQAVGKIRKQLVLNGFIKDQELILNYEKLGIEVHSISLIKVLPHATKAFKKNELNEVLQPVNAIRSYALPETDVTHVIIYAFKNIYEYDTYFRNLLKKFEGYIEIKHTFVFSSRSIIKSSSKNLFLNMLEEL
ncbi:AsnC family transcriptional regulator [Candidatus Woesearchaeota archaeon]|nr:AsnC family transcriptional regulator [Candidatus Woesearchaeota archaeon]